MVKIVIDSATQVALEDAIFNLVTLIPGHLRPKAAEHVDTLQRALNSTKDMFIDRRKLTWAPGSKARRTIETKHDGFVPQRYLVQFRSTGESKLTTLEDAAKMVNLSTSSLNAYINRSPIKQYGRTVDDGNITDIITIRRI